MARRGMTVTGNHKFAMALREFGSVVQNELFKHIAITAHKITIGARARAPVNTGKLQSGIKRSGPTRRMGKKSFGINARVTASAPYSAWVEPLRFGPRLRRFGLRSSRYRPVSTSSSSRSSLRQLTG